MKSILYKNAHVAFTDRGRGKVVVLLHGFLENSKMWRFLEPKLIEKHRVVCIDLLGTWSVGKCWLCSHNG